MLLGTLDSFEWCNGSSMTIPESEIFSRLSSTGWPGTITFRQNDYDVNELVDTQRLRKNYTLSRMETRSLLSGPLFFNVRGWWLNSMPGNVSSDTKVTLTSPNSPPVFWSITCQSTKETRRFIKKFHEIFNWIAIPSCSSRPTPDCRRETLWPAPMLDPWSVTGLMSVRFGYPR